MCFHDDKDSSSWRHMCAGSKHLILCATAAGISTIFVRSLIAYDPYIEIQLSIVDLVEVR